MTLSIRRRGTGLRSLIAGLAAVTIAMLAPGTALADTPSNDDFDTATTATSLPFKASLDTTESTKAPDDPTSCYAYGSRSVWFSYTAPTDGIVRATMSSGRYGPFIAVYTGERGALTPVPGGCTYYTGRPATFHVTAGTTYSVMLLESYNGGPVTFSLDSVPPSSNDNFASAAVTGLPASQTGDLAQASTEPGEAMPSCDATSDQSVWYRYTPDRTRSVSVVAVGNSPGITAYRGTAASALTEVDCVAAGANKSSVFTATAGQTYYIRVAADAEHATWYDLRLAVAPALAPFTNPWPDNPSVYDDVTFTPYSGDPLGRQLVSGEVRFGDGTSAPITGASMTHHYAVDGSYQVEVTGSTNDGRTGSSVHALKVETHDVTLSGFTLPTQAKAGQTKSFKVSVANTRYDETVKVSLVRLNDQGYYSEVGDLTQWVAASPGHKVEFPFAYTYTAADAAAGKVTLKVMAGLDGRYDGDDHPVDNELSATTTVRSAGAIAAV